MTAFGFGKLLTSLQLNKNDEKTIQFKTLQRIAPTIGKWKILDETFLELLNYRVSIEGQIFYNKKENYFLLLERYLRQVLTLNDFQLKFLEIEKPDSRIAEIIRKDFQELEVFTLANDLEKFIDLRTKISTLCLEYYEVLDGRPMSESEFYNLVKNSYLEF